MNKDQQKTVNKMLDAMELDSYGEKGLREIIRQSVVEIVKRSEPPKREPLSDEELKNLYDRHAFAVESVEYMWGFRDAEKAHGIGGGE